ncbi:MAG: hypothetical protein KAH01_04815 [Caldisericia bacterium]|nr:hypothetical protein [Caldisericia bacterium]
MCKICNDDSPAYEPQRMGVSSVPAMFCKIVKQYTGEQPCKKLVRGFSSKYTASKKSLDGPIGFDEYIIKRLLNSYTTSKEKRRMYDYRKPKWTKIERCIYESEDSKDTYKKYLVRITKENKYLKKKVFIDINEARAFRDEQDSHIN